ncbi:MAG: hypothetical protein HPY69_21040 [Armatimonadetes bacterium]|nr:hypothetical protein [Armatimonadota bacterium]
MIPVLEVGDRVRVIMADRGDRRRRDHGEAVVIGEFRCWRKVAAQDWADRYGNPVHLLAAYSDSTRHPGNVYRFDGWQLYDEQVRGSGGSRGRNPQIVSPKRLWVWRVDPPALPRQLVLEAVREVTMG